MKKNWDKLILGMELGGKFEEACRRNRFNAELLKTLTSESNLLWVRNMLLDLVRVAPLEGLVISSNPAGLPSKTKAFVLSCKQGGELQDACRRNEFSLPMLDLLAEGDNLGKVRSVLLREMGLAAVPERFFDLDTPPADRREGEGGKQEFSLNGMSIRTHIPGGQFKWHPDRIELWQSKRQFNEDGATLESIMKELEEKDKKPLNASLAFHLKRPENSHLIPPDWKFNDEEEIRNIVFLNTTVGDDRPNVSFFCYLCWCIREGEAYCTAEDNYWMTPKRDASLRLRYGPRDYFACQKW